MKSLALTTMMLVLSTCMVAQNSHIQVVAEPGISVFMDEQFKGTTTVEYGGLILQNVNSGQHKIKVLKEGYSPREVTLTVKAGEVLMYEVDKNFAPAIRITEEGNTEKQTISIRKGNLTIQSLPISIGIQISSIGVNYTKQEDKFYAENIPEGIYLAEFSWNEKILSDSVQIWNGMITYLFVNMIDDSIENKETKVIDQQTAERLRREEEQRRIDQANARATGAFSSVGNVGTLGQSQGVTGGQGNQGIESGTPDAPNYGPGGGQGTQGISFDLTGRKAQSLVMPSYDIQKDGVVVVAVMVDRSGRVTEATPGIKGSTTLDESLLKLAKEAALKTRFASSSDAPVIQKGTITYVFKLK